MFANLRADQMKVLVHDGIGIWLAARCLHRGRFVRHRELAGEQMSLTYAPLQALVLGLPWQHIGGGGVIDVLQCGLGPTSAPHGLNENRRFERPESHLAVAQSDEQCLSTMSCDQRTRGARRSSLC
ncbi:IS66 family insertion sequence element accessory protein TnpB [Paucibacter sp. M5-1]|uniref:IS66 family insertion sequence element accessory protein TnpB n=1 Tax=Paucibacter sp. M5-1 TaxID=3015998 RepID=UPI0022B8E56D|nr:IS66 family insertion sequence element accessory protein TnpB [Paucibacter sp. M5-1]MCZ7880548.1 IS66 family insertion sequence element accessory protein TnpB [Paucibacter sp. M5-1]